MNPQVYYRADGVSGLITAEESELLKGEGLTVTEVKPYLVNGNEEYFSDEEYGVLVKEGLELKPKMEAQDTPKEAVQARADYAKAEYWNKNRQMNNINVDTEFREQYIGDEAFETLKKRYADAQRKDPRDNNTQARFYNAEKELEFINTVIEPVYKEYKKQLVLKNGVVPVPDNEHDTALRNMHYAAKIGQKANEAVPQQEVDRLDDQIKGLQRRMAAAQRSGNEQLLSSLAIETEKAMLKKKKIGESTPESWEREVEKIEKTTGAAFLNGDEYKLSQDIQRLDHNYEVYQMMAEKGLGLSLGLKASQSTFGAGIDPKKVLMNQKAKIKEQEESVKKGWEKLNADADKDAGRLEDAKGRLDAEKQMLIDQISNYEENGLPSVFSSGLVEQLWEKVSDLEGEIGDIDKQIAQTTSRKDLFFQMQDNPEQAASDALSMYGGEEVPGSNAQERIRNLYAILATQYQDWGVALTKKMVEAGRQDLINMNPISSIEIFSKWGNVYSQLHGIDMKGFEMEEIEKLAQLEDQLKAIAPLAMLNRAPKVDSNEGAFDVFLSTFVNGQNPLSDRTTNQDIANNVVNSVRMVASTPMEYEQGIFEDYEEISSPYEHYSKKDFAFMLGQTADIMVDMMATELITAGLPGTFVKQMGAALRSKKAIDGATRLSIIAKKIGRGVSDAVWEGLEEGAKFEAAGLISGSDDELNFINGLFGSGLAKIAGTPFASESVKKFAYKKLAGLFGTKTPQALARINNFGVNSKTAIETLGRGPAEAIQEFGEEMGSIYQESTSWKEVTQKFEERFGSMSDVMHFAVMSAVMGYGMGVGNVVGDYWSARNKEYYSRLSSEERQQFTSFIQELTGEWQGNLDEYEEAIRGEDGTAEDTGATTERANEGGDTVDTDVQQDAAGDGEAKTAVTETLSKMGATEDLELMEGAAVGSVGDTEVILIDNGDSVTIESLYTPTDKRGGGSARKALEQIISVADEEGKELNLKVVPKEDSDTDRQRLEQFYADYGFELQEDGQTMIRPVGGVTIQEDGELQTEPTEVSGDTETEGGISEREAAIADEETALAEAEREVTGDTDGKVQTGTLPVSSIEVRPDVFQFKAIEDEGGTNKAEKIKSKKWNPNLAGTIAVWVDAKGELGEKGKVYVVDGHHRMQFAKEQGVENLNVYYMKADNAADARKEAALANIIMNRGTAIDAAKLYREMPEGDIDDNIVNSKNGRDGRALAKLSDALFKLVVDGKLSIERGVILSEAKDAARQEAVYQETLGKGAIGKNIKNSTLKEYVDAANATESETVTQVDLFGESQEEKVDVKAAMDFRADVRQRFLSDKTIFGAAARNADVLNNAGNVIDAEMSEGRSREAAENIALFDAFKNNVLKAILDDGAKRVAATKSKKERAAILDEVYDAVVERAKQELSGEPVEQNSITDVNDTVQNIASDIEASRRQDLTAVSNIPLDTNISLSDFGQLGLLNSSLFGQSMHNVILNIAKQFDITIRFTNGVNQLPEGVSANFDINSGTVLINLPNLYESYQNTINNRGRAKGTMLGVKGISSLSDFINYTVTHELIHGVTQAVYNDVYTNTRQGVYEGRLNNVQVSAIKSIVAIFNYLKSLDSEKYFGGIEYGLHNMSELMAEMSNEGFVSALQSISLPEDLRYSSVNNNVFENIISFIRELFVGKKTSNNVADSLFAAISDIITSPQTQNFTETNYTQTSSETIEDKINSRYDAELMALKNKTGAIDTALSTIDNWLADLDEFGKETLSMGIPVVVMVGVLKVAKATLEATRDIKEAVKDAIEHLRKTDWYGALNEQQKDNAEWGVSRVLKLQQVPRPKGFGFNVDSLQQLANKSKGKDGQLKAPNGNKSNLNNEQWGLVRTQEFKSWFGDWENDPDNSSKVVDENGEPKVVYHGTDAMFSIFDNNFSQTRNTSNGGYYFTSDIGVSKSYGQYAFGTFLNIRKPVTFANHITDQERLGMYLPEWMNTVVGMIKSGENKGSVLPTVNAPVKVDSDIDWWETVATKEQSSLKDRDGLIIEDVFDAMEEGPEQTSDIYVALSNNQIRSAEPQAAAQSASVEFLDSLISQLDQFGKESLSMGLPIVVAREILKAARAALVATQDIKKAFQAALEYMKETDWYKSLTDKEKSKADKDLEDLIVNNKADNIFGEALSPKQDIAEDFASSFMGSAKKNADGTYSGRKNNVQIVLSKDGKGGVKVVSLKTLKGSENQGRETKVIKEMIKLAEQMGTPLVYEANDMNGKNPLENRQMFLDAGFVPSTIKPSEVMFSPMPKKKEARQAMMKQFDEQIKAGATLDEMLAQVDARDYGKELGISNYALKNALRNMYERYERQGLNQESKAKRRVHGLYDRLMSLVVYDAEMKALKEAGVDLYYDILNNKEFNATMQQVYDQLIEESDGNLELAAVAFRALMKETFGDAILAADLSLPPAIYTNLLQKLISQALAEGQMDLWASLMKELANSGTGFGRGINQMAEGSSPESFMNSVVADLVAKRDKAIGEDAEVLEDMAKEMRKAMKELFDKDVNIEELLEEIAQKDEKIAKLLEDLKNAETKVNADVNAANNQNTETKNKAKSKPNRTADKARQIADNMRKFADDLRTGKMSMAIVMTPKLMAKAIEAFAKALEVSANTLEAMDKAFEAMRSEKEYVDADRNDQIQMGKDLKDTLFENVDGLKEDVDKVSQQMIKPKLWVKQKNGKKKQVNADRVSLKELIENHVSGNTQKNRSLAEAIALKTGIQDLEALKTLEDAIYEQIKERVEAKIEEELKNKADKLEKQLRKGLALSPEQRKIVIEKLSEQVMNGALSNDSVKDAFADYYGFAPITPELISKLQMFVDILEAFKASGDSAGAVRVSEEFAAFIRENANVKVNWAARAIDWVNMAALSGTKTQTNALWGAISELIPQLIVRLVPDLIRSPRGVASGIAAAFSDGSFGRSMRAAYASAARGESNVNGLANALNESTTTSTNPDYKFWDMLIKEGYRKNKPLITRVISYTLQPLRGVFWLGAADAFMNGTARNYLEYVDQYHKATGTSSWVQRVNPKAWGKFHEAVMSTLNPQLSDKEAFESRLEEAYNQGMDSFNALGITPPSQYRSVLKQQMIDDHRRQMGVTMHQETIKDWMMMANPTGPYVNALSRIRRLTRPDYDNAILNALTIVPAIMLMLSRITLVGIQKATKGIPLIGMTLPIYEAISGEMTILVNGKAEKVKIKNGVQHVLKAAVAQALLTTVSGIIMGNMFDLEDDDEDDDKYARERTGPHFFGKRVVLDPNRLIDISSGVSGVNQIGPSQDEPYELRVKIGGEWQTITKLNYVPSVQVMLNVMGRWRDELVYVDEFKRKDLGVNPNDLGAAYLDMLGEATYSQLSRDIKSVVRGGADKAGENLGNIAARLPFSFVPNAYRDAIYTALSTQDFERQRGRTAVGSALQLAGIMEADDVPFVDNYGNILPYANKALDLPGARLLYGDARERFAEGKVQYDLWDSREGLMDKKITRQGFQELSVYKYNDDGKIVKDQGAKPIAFGKYAKDEQEAMVVAARTLYGGMLAKNQEGLMKLNDEQFISVTDEMRSRARTLAQAKYFQLYRKNGNDIVKNTQELIKSVRNEKQE